MNALFQSLIGAKRSASITSSSNRIVLGATYFFYFGLLGIFAPYVGLFLDNRGFSSVQIGNLLALVALVRILGPNIWASIADKTGKVGEVLRLGCLLACVTFLLIYLVKDYSWISLTFCLMMMFWTAVLPQLEVITVSATANSSGGYGKLRLWGSLGFIACSLLVGGLIDIFGPEVTIIATSITLFSLYICTLLIVSPKPKLNETHNGKSDWRQAMGLMFVVFLLANSFLQMSFGTYYNFFALYMQDLGHSGLMTGIFLALGVVAEVFIFIYAARILKKYTVTSLLAFSMFITALRWLALAYFAQFVWVIILSQLLHALGFGLTHAASVYFLSQHFTAQFQSRAQALYVSIAFGIGGSVGSYVAGLMWKQGAGAQSSFEFSAITAFLGGVALLVLMLIKSNNTQTSNN